MPVPARRRSASPQRPQTEPGAAGIDLTETLDLFGIAGTSEHDTVAELVATLEHDLRSTGRLPDTAALRVNAWRYGILTLAGDPQSVTLLRYDLDRLREELAFSFELRGLTLRGLKLTVHSP